MKISAKYDVIRKRLKRIKIHSFSFLKNMINMRRKYRNAYPASSNRNVKLNSIDIPQNENSSFNLAPYSSTPKISAKLFQCFHVLNAFIILNESSAIPPKTTPRKNPIYAPIANPITTKAIASRTCSGYLGGGWFGILRKSGKTKNSKSVYVLPKNIASKSGNCRFRSNRPTLRRTFDIERIAARTICSALKL